MFSGLFASSFYSCFSTGVMKIFAWNCRGLGQASAICDLQALMSMFALGCLILMETKVNVSTLQNVLAYLNFPHNVYVPPIGLDGGFCVAWRASVDMEPITMNKHLISLLVFSTPGPPVFSMLFMVPVLTLLRELSRIL